VGANGAVTPGTRVQGAAKYLFEIKKNDILRESRFKLLSRIRKLVVVFIELHNLLGVGDCDYSPRGGKKESVVADHF